MASVDIKIVNINNLEKIENFLNDSAYREVIENSENYNTRLCIERRLRMPFLDPQTGVAQNHCTLFMKRKQRMPGLRDGQIYSYPAARWRKSRRQYLLHQNRPFGMLRDTDGDSIGLDGSSIGAGDTDSKDSQNVRDTEVPKDWYYDEMDIHDIDGFHDPEPDSDYDYEDHYSNSRKKRKRTPAKSRGPLIETPTRRGGSGGGRGSGRGRRKNMPIVFDPDSPHSSGSSRGGGGGGGGSSSSGGPAGLGMGSGGSIIGNSGIAGMSGPGMNMLGGGGSGGMRLPPNARFSGPPHYPPQPPPGPQQHPPITGVVGGPQQLLTMLDEPQMPVLMSEQKMIDEQHNNAQQLHPQMHHQHPQHPQHHPQSPHTSLQHPPQQPQQQQLQPSGGGAGGPQQQPNHEENFRPKQANEKGKAAPSPYCDFCLGDARENKKTRIPEELVSCSDCGRSGHPTCLQFTPNMMISVKRYRWQCIECKYCSICGTSDNDDQLLFCDDCDRGYHMYCLAPPLTVPPEGSWSCKLCQEEFHNKK